MTPTRFRNLVFAHYKKHGRHDLPWRKTKDPYRILVSEVMLQQTQVERVLPFYKAFLKEFPDVKALATAPLARVLIRWQGLGYNRRAKMLHEAAKTVVKDYVGKMPNTVEALEKLPGVGHYTARAVAAFAYNEDVILIETNLRTAVTHHFFPNEEKVSDKEILLILEKLFRKGTSREWYSALMDYGAFLKRSGVRINAKSKTHAKQSAFVGSGREARGAILRALSKEAKTEHFLSSLLGSERSEQVAAQLEKLAKEGFLEKKNNRYQLAS
ncbi:MAG: A/G-specific adenine glycosylase [Rectinemataceae bacterium]|nr:A/G-specific adenine glycosylase [Rectinemataceae bacterium]